MIKHPVEEIDSWELYLDRIHPSRKLRKDHKKHHGLHETDKNKKNGAPEPRSNTIHGLMIDAGSQGTRIHLYEFERRVLHHTKEVEDALNGLKISYPTTNSRWTNRLKPGLDYCVYQVAEDDDEGLIDVLKEYLSPLLDFAKLVLEEKEHDWEHFPIYLKATGGLRTLPTLQRIRLMNHVRLVLHDKIFNPFGFVDERARVISGEEEAIYGWAGVNFIKGTLLAETEGAGTVLNPNMTYGMIEMGGASTQIGFFEPNGDVMANLFKLQIGGARHWNVYVHSFLYFGVSGAWSRLNAQLYRYNLGNGTAINPCLPLNAEVNFTSWIHATKNMQLLPRSSPLSTEYSVTMKNNKIDFDACSSISRKLLRKEANYDWVNFSHDGDASFAGIYQPPLPTENSAATEFIATSNFADIWQFLGLKERSTVAQIQERAKVICRMDADKLVAYNSKVPKPARQSDLFQYCFRGVFAFEMIHTGYGFPLDFNITAADTMNGQKLGWALGSILYEINTLPWEFKGKFKGKTDEKYTSLGMSNLFSRKEADGSQSFVVFAVVVSVAMAAFSSMIATRRRRSYESIPNDHE